MVVELHPAAQPLTPLRMRSQGVKDLLLLSVFGIYKLHSDPFGYVQGGIK